MYYFEDFCKQGRNLFLFVEFNIVKRRIEMKNMYIYQPRNQSSDLNERERFVKKSWSNYVKKGIEPIGIRSDILSSWKRSKEHHINPNAFLAPVCKHDVLIKKLKENKEILTLIRPYMDDLYEMVNGTDSIIAFADKDGIVLDLCGDSEIAMNAASVNFTVGVNMSEESIGTNSIGTALVTGKAIQVTGAEHFCSAWHTSNCSSSPIMDPFTNDIIGIITLIGYVRSSHPHSLGLVKTASETITKLIEHQGIKREKYIINNYFNAVIDSISDGIILVNRSGEIIRSNKIACHILRIPFECEQTCKLSEIEHLQPLAQDLDKAVHDSDVILQHEFDMPNEEKFNLLCTSRRIMVDGKHMGNIIILRKKRNKESKKNTAKYFFSSLLGEDYNFKRAIQLASKGARTDKSILIIGESGTGKELFAQSIHNASTRQDGPFIAINTAAIPKALIASELFGYVDGAFTNAVKGGKQGKFEAANGGTIFLDEIGDMPLELQAHLLRVLEEKEIMPVGSNLPRPIDVRIIAATNKDLFQLVKENKFRLDLYYRLNVISIHIPPLKNRKDDIELLAKHFLPTKEFSPKVLKYFYGYEWPGNLRELKNIMEQIEIFCDETVVTEAFLPDYLKNQFEVQEKSEGLFEKAVEETKKESIVITLKNSKNVAEAAKKLGISSSTLYRWANEYDLNIKELVRKLSKC